MRKGGCWNCNFVMARFPFQRKEELGKSGKGLILCFLRGLSFVGLLFKFGICGNFKINFRIFRGFSFVVVDF